MPGTRRLFASSFLFIALLIPAAAHPQCMLANPSFELPGSGGNTFAGWNQFGAVSSTNDAPHGADAARVSGLNQSGQSVSGTWQPMDTEPGERWAASVQGWHTAINPLTGLSRAILNIEWRDGGGNLISYESHTVADASTPMDVTQSFSVESAPAPLGTASARLLLGVLEAPGEPLPDVYYDVVTFDKVGPPSLEDLQWGDFPGGTTLEFSGRTWRVKGDGFYGPGPNLFNDSPSCVGVDRSGRLHLTVRNVAGSWYSTEVVLEESLGYGDYVFTTVGRLDALDPNIVFGIFLWQYGPCYDPANGWWNPLNEIDIEFSRWGNPANDPAQFVAQPYDFPGNIDRFAVTFSEGEVTSHAMRWLRDRVEYRSWRGGPNDEAPGTLIHAWTYTGPHIPRPEIPRVHLNLWKLAAPPSSQEVVVESFNFLPAPSVTAVPGDDPTRAKGAALLAPARPSPFRARTAISYSLDESRTVNLTVQDISGRRVRVLDEGIRSAGEHESVWDGRDTAGRELPAGIYFFLLHAGDHRESRRVVLLR